MFYASDLVQVSDFSKKNIEALPESSIELVSKVLVEIVERRLQKNLSYNFMTMESDLTRVRGKIDLLRTERRGLLAKGKVACIYDSLQINTPLNKYVLSALLKASRLATGEIAKTSHRLAIAFSNLGVSLEDSAVSRARVTQFGYVQRDDRIMFSAAKLIHEMALPTEERGIEDIRRPGREEVWIRKLFEKAVGGFYKINLDRAKWRVSTGKYLSWKTSNESKGLAAILPSMQTDIVIEEVSTSRKIVIDTKFTSILRRGFRRDQTLKSNYIYQIYTYLFSQHIDGDCSTGSQQGMLLHPSLDCDLDEYMEVQGKIIRFATVDLRLDTLEIRKRLLHLTKPVEFY